MKLFTLSLGLSSLLYALVSQAGTIHEGLPPIALHGSSSGSWMPVGDGIVAGIGVNTREKTIQFNWRGYEGEPHNSPKTHFVVQKHAVSFWPTAAEVVDERTILVAGKEPRSHITKIERWTIAPPKRGVRYAQGPHDQGLILKPVVEKEVVYAEAVPGRDMVHFILDVQGPGSNALVRFADSGDIYQLDWKAEPYPITRFATASGAKGTEMEIPELSGTFDQSSRGDHIEDGYMHWFSHGASLGRDPVVAFIDLDRDGIIDVFEIFSTYDWATGGHGLESQWIEFDGRIVRKQ
ncbi:MAG: hypothetical protein ACI8TQ_001920 [Planctomycetota bacterium]|jgi:hypothetical protein